MIPNITRGGKMHGLMNYLVGPGRANEHTDQRFIGGDPRAELEFSNGQKLDKYNAFELSSMLEAPSRAFGTSVTVPDYARDGETGELLLDEAGKKIQTGRRDAHVWHCSLSIKEDQGSLSDMQWNRIAHTFMDKMGFVDPDGRKSVRWAAIHHGASKNGNDHIHLLVNLVNEDGTKAKTHNDFHRAQKAAREIEREYGLTQLSTELGKGLSGEKPAERARAQREGQTYSARPELRRRMYAAMATANNAHEYVKALDKMGVHVAPSFEKGSTTKLRGYKVSLGASESGENGKAVWYAPSKLDSLLSWPKVRDHYQDRGVKEAEHELAGHHSSSTVPASQKIRVPGNAAGTFDRLTNEPTSPQSLAHVYARASMQMEQNQPGPLADMAQHMARAGQHRSSSPGEAAYLMRLNQRFGDKNPEQAWLAVLRQANRLARTMAQGRYGRERPQEAAMTSSALAQAEAIVNREAQRLGQMQPSTAVRTPQGATTPPRTVAGIYDRSTGRDTGRGR